MRLTLIGIIVILIGFALVFAGSVSSISPSNSTVGGVVLIGPIPIIFGKGSEGNLIPLMIIGLIFTIIAIIFFLGSIWIFRKSQ
ncbi:TIGR00304 family membrane protein [Metallosphaera hakonensis]|uniref:DUF131 domain-containing protein n=1 Tax=Metallosphaera hakonensis JCM 8857 = DSM 7519 TaxID=1293036 RepID=A0A2U9IUN2_9CREN|nr:DUF131 domain-containing protein [Metallosphaera hakonensis]AWR99557.1 DUF131 domain-containing protein [Metallosphaera hakonensis JCM 8857 = DSM 7519]